MVCIEDGYVPAVFLERLNRFEALVRVGDREERVHVPNTGRLKELLIPGAEVSLLTSDNPRRKTRYSLAFVRKKEHWFCIVSAWANRVFAEAVKKGAIDWLSGEVRGEVRRKGSRMDFLIGGNTWVEVKGVTYEEEGIARFPDAPTERGRRHLEELIQLRESGSPAAVVFVALMENVTRFEPFVRIDPAFAGKLREAASKGVLVRAYKCRVRPGEVFLLEELPVDLNAGELS
jgi:sugar fermentation stimulation protein A